MSRIWLIQTGEPLPLNSEVKKMRTAWLADELVKKGHKVLWWASTFDHRGKKWIARHDMEFNFPNGLEIMALKGIGYKKNISLARYIDHRLVAKKFKRLAASKPKPDAMVVSLPPHDLAFEAVMFARKNKIPVMIDIRDPWPDLFLNHVPIMFKKIIRVALFNDFRMVKHIMRYAQNLVAVTRAFLEWGLGYAERGPNTRDRVFYLGYRKPSVQNLEAHMEMIKQWENTVRDKFVVLFIGALSAAYHNPSILLDAAERLKDRDQIHFVIAGDGDLLADMRKSAGRLSNVTFTGWLNQMEIDFWLKHSHVGVCPVTKIIDLPTNKVSAYLSEGLPILSAFNGELKTLIEDNRIGFYYAPNDIRAFEKRIVELQEDRELYRLMSRNAQKLFQDKFDAAEIYRDYAEHVGELAAWHGKELKHGIGGHKK
ncbi:MAG: glycosyltransferase WbuB [Desulfobacteraceae bacterium]|nr:MAG: glycosyltransferase WbuB [Desulfobacteraceae bacterium]